MTILPLTLLLGARQFSCGLHSVRVSPMPRLGRPYHVINAIIIFSVLDEYRPLFSTRYLLYLLTLLGLQSRFRDKSLKFQVICPHNGTAVLKGFRQ